MNMGDRVKYKTMGGWYNSGIIKDINEDSYLIEVDEFGCKPPKDIYIPLPYYARVLSCEIINEKLVAKESEGKGMDRISGIRKNIEDEIDAIWRKAFNAGKEAGYEEAKSNYDTWNQKKEEVDKIHVGDEVYFCDEKHPRVVTCIFTENGDYTKAIQITESGKYCVDEIKNLHKTGRHFDIQSILDQIKE